MSVHDIPPCFKGQAGEALFTAECLMRGLGVSMASEGMPYDVVVDTGSVLHRVQVKSVMAAPRDAGAYHLNTKTGRPGNWRPYTKDETDWVAVWLGREEDWWNLPVELVSTLTMKINPKHKKWEPYRDNWEFN